MVWGDAGRAVPAQKEWGAEGQSTPRKNFPHLFPINKGCSSRDGGGDGTVASGWKVMIAGRCDRGP